MIIFKNQLLLCVAFASSSFVIYDFVLWLVFVVICIFIIIENLPKIQKIDLIENLNLNS